MLYIIINSLLYPARPNMSYSTLKQLWVSYASLSSPLPGVHLDKRYVVEWSSHTEMKRSPFRLPCLLFFVQWPTFFLFFPLLDGVAMVNWSGFQFSDPSLFHKLSPQMTGRWVHLCLPNRFTTTTSFFHIFIPRTSIIFMKPDLFPPSPVSRRLWIIISPFCVRCSSSDRSYLKK